MERDLLNSITSCGSYDLFSRPWYESCPIYNRLAHVNEAEMKISDSKEGSTLWETEENALRHFVELGKTRGAERIGKM